jgi:hypothetical protein
VGEQCVDVVVGEDGLFAQMIHEPRDGPPHLDFVCQGSGHAVGQVSVLVDMGVLYLSCSSFGNALTMEKEKAPDVKAPFLSLPLQSRCKGPSERWSGWPDSNRRPPDPQSAFDVFSADFSRFHAVSNCLETEAFCCMTAFLERSPKRILCRDFVTPVLPRKRQSGGRRRSTSQLMPRSPAGSQLHRRARPDCPMRL